MSSIWLSEMETVDLKKLEFLHESNIWRKKKLKFDVSGGWGWVGGSSLSYGKSFHIVLIAYQLVLQERLEVGSGDGHLNQDC